jgi:hypothetical protein
MGVPIAYCILAKLMFYAVPVAGSWSGFNAYGPGMDGGGQRDRTGRLAGCAYLASSACQVSKLL